MKRINLNLYLLGIVLVAFMFSPALIYADNESKEGDKSAECQKDQGCTRDKDKECPKDKADGKCEKQCPKDGKCCDKEGKCCGKDKDGKCCDKNKECTRDKAAKSEDCDKQCPHQSKKENGTASTTYLFGNHICPVSGHTSDNNSFVEYKDEIAGVYGRIYLCCDGCSDKVEKDLKTIYGKLYLTDKVSGQPIEARDLKNETCPISNEPIKEDAAIEYNGMKINFCCSGCAKEFLKDPDAKLTKLVPNLEDYKYQKPAGSQSSM